MPWNLTILQIWLSIPAAKILIVVIPALANAFILMRGHRTINPGHGTRLGHRNALLTQDTPGLAPSLWNNLLNLNGPNTPNCRSGIWHQNSAPVTLTTSQHHTAGFANWKAGYAVWCSSFPKQIILNGCQGTVFRIRAMVPYFLCVFGFPIYVYMTQWHQRTRHPWDMAQPDINPAIKLVTALDL